MKNLIKSCFRKPCKQSNNAVIKIKFCSAHQLLNNPSSGQTPEVALMVTSYRRVTDILTFFDFWEEPGRLS